jgi:hypothetical protein
MWLSKIIKISHLHHEKLECKGRRRYKNRGKSLAKLIVMSPNNNTGINCLLRELVEKSFTEHILWLEDRTKSQLDNITINAKGEIRRLN